MRESKASGLSVPDEIVKEVGGEILFKGNVTACPWKIKKDSI